MASEPPVGQAGALATETAPIRLDRLQLLGIAGSDANRRALVRLPNGTVETVRIGDTIGTAPVVAIEVDHLALADGGRARKLSLP